MLGSRTIRVLAAAFVCSAVVGILWSRVTGYVSVFAVVNAPVLTVRAPTHGIIQQASPGLAAPVLRDQSLFALQATERDLSALALMRAELRTKREEALALQEQERGAIKVIAALRGRVKSETESELVFVTRKLEEARADRTLNEIAWDQAASDIERLGTLHKKGRTPLADLEDARFRQRMAEAELNADDARIAALIVELTAIEEGLPSPAGTGRRDFAYDRLDDMQMALADIRTHRIAAEARRDALQAELASLEERSEALALFQPAASTNGVIWTASRQAGASVTLGSDLFQILDCERRFIEVVFNERTFERIQAGTKASVVLRGSRHPFEATVLSRHAAGRGAANSAVDAALLDPYETGGVKVFLAIDAADVTDPGVAQAFCDVGRTAEVHIPHDRFSTFLASASALLWPNRPRFATLTE